MIACAGAAAITGKPLARIEVHGKQLFYFFGEDPATQVLQSCVDDDMLGQELASSKGSRSQARAQCTVAL